LRENNLRQSIKIIEENILLTLSLAPQSYHTECCTLNMYYKVQLITAIYIGYPFSISTWPTTSCRVEPCDV